MAGIARKLLKFLQEHPRQTPKSISEQLESPLATVKTTLGILSDLELIEAKTRGLYEITKMGDHVLRRV